MTAEPDAHLAALRAAGVADDDDTPATLTTLAGRSVELDRAVVARLARTVDEAHALALRDVGAGAERRGWKAVAKDVRRALYRFGQRGVVPAPSTAPEPPQRPRWAASPLEGWVSAVDGRGDRLVWIARTQPSGGLLVMTAIVNEPAGLRDVTLAELSRKSLRRMHDDLQARHGVRMVEAEGGYCDALVAEAYERARAAGTAEAVGRYPTLRARMTTQPPAPLEPPLIVRVAGTVADPAAVAAGARLLEEVELATWTLDRATLAPHLAAVTAARESPIVLSRPQQEERVHAALAATRRALFGGPQAATYRRRLEETAYVLHASGRPELARSAAATATALAGGDHETPFFVELLRRSVAAHLAEDEAKARAEAESSVLVRPGAGALPPRPPRR